MKVIDGEWVDDAVYTVSITFERWEPGDVDDGEPSDRGWVVEGETYDAEQVERLNWDYGFTESSGGANPSFSTTSPKMDREHIEGGVDKFYSFHLKSVNGHAPENEDYRRVARMFGMDVFSNVALDEDDPPPQVTAAQSPGL